MSAHMRPIDRELDEMYAVLKRRQPVASAREQVAAIYPRIHTAGDAAALRLAKDRYKKLQDEIRPALTYAASELPPGADIEFHLSDRGPDATAWCSARSPGMPIEVTNATDDDSAARIKHGYEDHRAYSTEEAVKVIAAGIVRCVNRKRRHARTVIIDAPLNVLPARKWPDAMAQIAGQLPESRCPAIFVVGYNDGNDACHRLK